MIVCDNCYTEIEEGLHLEVRKMLKEFPDSPPTTFNVRHYCSEACTVDTLTPQEVNSINE